MALFTDLGAQCSLPYCRQNDFLPFSCDCCNKVYCKDHFQYKDHECPLGQNKTRQVAVCPICQKSFAGSDDQQVDALWDRHIQSECTGRQVKEKCPVAGCKEKLTELSSVICPNCKSKVCLKHRFEDLHSCATLKKQNAASKSWKPFGGKASNSASKPKPKAGTSGNSGPGQAPKLGGGGAVSSLFGRKKSTGSASCGRCGTCDKCKASKAASSPQWACSACTLLNPASSTKCGACGIEKRKISPQTTSPRGDKSEWECQNCSYSNMATRTTCLMCGKKAPTDGCVAS